VTESDRRDLFQRVLMRDQMSLLVLDELLRMLHYWDSVSGEEMVLHNFGVRLMATMGLHREETTIEIIKAMQSAALKIQAAEGGK